MIVKFNEHCHGEVFSKVFTFWRANNNFEYFDKKSQKKKSEGKSDLIPNPFVSLLFEFLFRENKGIGTSV